MLRLAGPLFCFHGTFMAHRDSRPVPNGTSFPRTSVHDRGGPSALNESPPLRRRARPSEVPIRNEGEVVDLAAGVSLATECGTRVVSSPVEIPVVAPLTIAAAEVAAIA
jgi:hypothetical protein